MKNITEHGAGINLFFALKDDAEEVYIKKADLEAGDTQENLLCQFISLLQEDFMKDELTILEISAAEERSNTFYHYDLEIFPASLSYFQDFDYSNKYEMFSFQKDDLSKIVAYIIVIGNQVDHCVLYKRFYPVYLLGRGSFCLIPSRQRFRELDEEILRVSRDYQFIRIDDDIYIKDLSVLEKFGGFKDIIEKEAAIAVEEIAGLDILEEPEILQETLSTDLTFARKLCKIKRTSPVIRLNIPNENIIEFSKTHPGTSGKLKYNADENRIVLTTKKSQNIFLKILDDSFLVSQLTKLYYDSLSKEQVNADAAS